MNVERASQRLGAPRLGESRGAGARQSAEPAPSSDPEIAGNQFKIAGGAAGLKVSWQVTGTRHDPYANQNRIQVEEIKPAKEQGRYLYPAGYGQPASRGMAFLQPASAPATTAQPMRPGDAAVQSDGQR